jgi:4-hydroxythreonine-4-phosphate dehydrogenase
MNQNLPKIAITMGDPAGIGPEIVARALSHQETYAQCRPLVTGDAAIMQKAVELLQLPLTVHAISSVSEAKFEYGTIDVFDLHCVDLSTFAYGQVAAQCGNAAFVSIKKAIDLAMADEVDATVTAPLNKEALNLSGHHFDGHTEIYATFTNTKKYAMLLADEFLRVIHVSTHVSLREACDRVKKARIIEVTELINDACIQFGIEHPRIGIAGLNPHSSDNGLFGWEEEKEIIPAVQELTKRGFNVVGPVPPDTLFAKAKCGQFDGCVAMYHDQGHIPFKVVGFNWNKETGKMDSVKGVNITLGLPIIRVSVDHGTAFDVAGKGVASEDAMMLSIDYATRMAHNRLKRKANA